MTRSELINRGATRWSAGITNHVTRSDQHDRQYCAKGDDGRRCQTWGDDGRQCQMKGDDDRRGATMVWLGSLES